MMAVLVETMDELNWRKGRNFAYVYSANGLSENDIIFLCLNVGASDIALTKIEFSGSSSLLTWKWHIDSQIDNQTGTLVNEIPMNRMVSSSSGVKLLVNPDITDIGAQLISSLGIDVIGTEASSGMIRLNETILSKNLTVLKNTTQIIEIKNRHVGSANLEVTISLFTEPNQHG